MMSYKKYLSLISLHISASNLHLGFLVSSGDWFKYGNVGTFSEVVNFCFQPIKLNKFKTNTVHLWDILATSLLEENYAMIFTAYLICLLQLQRKFRWAGSVEPIT
jgi:hypothetical protein